MRPSVALAVTLACLLPLTSLSTPPEDCAWAADATFLPCPLRPMLPVLPPFCSLLSPTSHHPSPTLPYLYRVL